MYTFQEQNKIITVKILSKLLQVTTILNWQIPQNDN